MNKSAWLKKILDMITRISTLYCFNELIGEDFKGERKEYTFKTDNSFYLEARILGANLDSYKELKDYLLALNKGFGFKKYYLAESEDDLSLSYLVNDNVLGSISNIDEYLCLLIDLEEVIKTISSENRNIEGKKFLHLYLIALNDEAKKEALKSINICRLGGLQSEIALNPKDIEEEINKAYEYNSLFIATYDGNELSILNTSTNEEKQININELYPYVITYVRGLNKCSGCKEKEE